MLSFLSAMFSSPGSARRLGFLNIIRLFFLQVAAVFVSYTKKKKLLKNLCKEDFFKLGVTLVTTTTTLQVAGNNFKCSNRKITYEMQFVLI